MKRSTPEGSPRMDLGHECAQDKEIAHRWVEGIGRVIVVAALTFSALAVTAPSAQRAAAATAPVTSTALSGIVGKNGWFTSPTVLVTLTGQGSGAGAIQTFYRILPATTYTLYSGPFTVAGQGKHTINYYSVQGPLTEGVRSTTFSNDSVAPVTYSSVQGTLTPSGWYHGKVAISLAANDATSGVAAAYWKKDALNFATYNGPISLSGSGQRQITYYSIDKAGNAEGQHLLTLPIDNDPPVLTTPTVNGVAYAQAQHTLAGPVSIILGASDALSGLAVLNYQINNGAWTAYGAPLTLGAAGTYTIHYAASDRAGNSTAQGTLQLVVATMAPSVSASLAGTAGSNGWYRSAVGVTLSTNPATGVTAYYTMDNGPQTTYSGPFAVGGDGHHVVTYSATGSGGITAAQQAQIYIDTAPPTTVGSVVGSTPNGAGWFNHAVTIRLDAADNASGVAATYWQKDGQGAFSLYNGQFNLDTPGNHAITYYSIDRAGNTEGAKSLPVRIDSQAPATTATVNGGTLLAGAYTTTVSVALRPVDDLSGVAGTNVTVDGVASAYTAPIVLSTPGLHIITYSSVDVAGNVEATNRINVPLVAPAAPATAAPPPTLLPTQTPIVVGPTAIPTPAPRPQVTARLSANVAQLGWDRTFRLTVRTTPALPHRLVQVLIRTDARRPNWRIIRTNLTDSRGMMSWAIRTRQSAAYEVIVEHTITSRAVDVRVSSVVTLRRVLANLPGQALLTGRAWPEARGHMVALQEEGAHGTWHTVATTLLGARGAFTFVTPVDALRIYHWRVWNPPMATLVGGKSNIVTLVNKSRR